ncbi:MAG: hypothetical protein QGM50_10285 [Anaerolineae bacterium]|nr:hypothetical protein [Anaerolineae bacterium]MDK1080913.1 hypothetical protein [Anaerolineae bacterium]MDK1119160.1 hypothetical protein [Anaerolineae bacterium]
MKLLFLIFIFIFSIQSQTILAQEEADDFKIISPFEGQVIQGIYVISGSVNLVGFSSYTLSFAFNEDPTQTWFLLNTNSLPVFEGEIGIWDTTTLTDGDYSLRLYVVLSDGSEQESIVTNLQVRNYTLVPISESTSTKASDFQFSPPTALLITPELATQAKSFPTLTLLPANPAALTEPEISRALLQGAALVFILFLGFGIFIRLRRE